MKNPLLIPLIFVLSGCYQQVDQSDLIKATKLCGSQEKILFIKVVFTSAEIIKCLDGTYEYLW